MPRRKSAGSTPPYVVCDVTVPSQAKPTPTRTMPTKTTTLVPSARTSQLESIATMSSTRAMGYDVKTSLQGAVAEQNCKYWVRRNSPPESEKSTNASRPSPSRIDES